MSFLDIGRLFWNNSGERDAPPEIGTLLIKTGELECLTTNKGLPPRPATNEAAALLCSIKVSNT